MVDAINTKAYQLVGLLSHKPKEKKDSGTEPVGSSKERGVIDLSGKIAEVNTVRTTDHSGTTIEIFFPIVDGSVGFDKNNYPRFQELINDIHSVEQFNRVLSLAYIETESFKWIIGINQNNKAESSLIDFLLNSMEVDVRLITLYFPVLNLEIETPFRIGHVEFTYFTKDYFDEVYETYKSKNGSLTEEQFNILYRKDFQSQVLAKITVKAEKGKAEEIAKKYAEISVDVLKMYSDSIIVPEKNTMFDLNFRLSYLVQSNYLFQNPDKPSSLQLNMQYQNIPFNFTQKRLSSASQNGLTIFSDYISQRNQHELDELIIQAILLFGSAISNWDLHVRCVNLITILESILLGVDEKWGMEKKVRARLTKLLSSQIKDIENIKSILEHIYQVRHKMIHKAIKIDIDLKKMSEFQRLIINMFLRLIQRYRVTITNKADLIKELGADQS